MADTSKYRKNPPGKLRTMLRTESLKKKVNQVPRDEAAGVLEDLVQCGICLERLTDPRMLPCQHTFCLNCLQTHLLAKNLSVKHDPPSADQIKLGLSSEIKSTHCPICQREIMLEKGFDSLDSLPKNLYINSLLKLLDGSGSPGSPKTVDYRCIKCQTVSDQQEHICQHCMQIFCGVCWNDHISELDSNMSQLIRQIDESGSLLRHKADNFASRCEKLKETIKETVEQRIAALRKMEVNVGNEVTSVNTQQNIVYENINSRIQLLRDKIKSNIDVSQCNNKVSTYMNLHRETSKLLNEVIHYGEARLLFDPETFQLDQESEGIYNDLEEKDAGKHTSTDNNPFESTASMVKHYKSRSVVPKLLWTKCPRPGGVGIPPWDTTKIYIAATDSHCILVLTRSKFKLIARIHHPDMLYPSSLAFSKSRKEIYASDKWKHCIHVFSNDGEYLRNMWPQKLRNPEGIAMGPNEELIVCDTGNNRVLIIDSGSAEFIRTIGVNNGKTTLNTPSDVAVYGSNVIVADTGNHRIKVYSMEGQLINEFGSLGRGKEQFRSAEVVAVDCLGFIFVGDAGNARIQVFMPDGTLVKIFGSREGFGWISGIYVTPELDIITTDIKTRSLRIF